jgi:hypothetical protein
VAALFIAGRSLRLIDLLSETWAKLEGSLKCCVACLSIATSKLAEPKIKVIVCVERLKRTSLRKSSARLVDFTCLEGDDTARALVVCRAGLILAGSPDLLKSVLELSASRK